MALQPCIGASAAVTAYPASVCQVYSGSNIQSHEYNYDRWADPVLSSLLRTEDGEWMKFQADAVSGRYGAEYYDDNWSLKNAMEIEEELPLFGAFYDDGTNYYVLSGQKNLSEDDSTEVFRLTKYTHNWEGLGSASLYGANTLVPFDGGSASIEHDGNSLFIRTCHTMYTSPKDGLNHQSNLMFQVETSSMEVEKAYYDLSNTYYGYCSHSFNQFIKMDNGYVVGIDHGDAYPRSIVLSKHDPSTVDQTREVKKVDLLSIDGDIGANDTGVSIGGFEISADNYLVAGNTVAMGEGYDPFSIRNIFVASVDRDLSETPKLTLITDYKDGENPSNPQFVKVDDHSFLLLWEKDGKINYCEIDEFGNQNSTILTMDGHLSDCKPVVYDQKLTWYTWEEEKTCFYQINVNSLSDTDMTKVVKGHKDDIIVTKIPTCAENGSRTLTCQICGDVREETMNKDPENHVGGVEVYNAIEPTYYKEGHTGYTVCKGCMEILDYGETIPKLTEDPDAYDEYGHSYDENGKIVHEWSSWKTKKQATVFETGSKERSCDCCGKKQTETIAKKKPTITLSATKKTLKKNKTYVLSVSKLAKGDSVKSVTSGNKSVATVKKTSTNKYKITAKKKGKATITVKLKSGKKATCTVTVKN